jgi:hypothetical protein
MSEPTHSEVPDPDEPPNSKSDKPKPNVIFAPKAQMAGEFYQYLYDNER